MKADQILTPTELGEDLQYDTESAVADRNRLTRARDGAVRFCASDLKRPLLVESRNLTTVSLWTSIYSRDGPGLPLIWPDIRTVTKVERRTADGTAEEVAAAELGNLVTGESRSVQFLDAASRSGRVHTVTFDAGLDDDSDLWPLIRSAMVVWAGAHLDGQGLEEAQLAASRVLDGARLEI